MRRVASLLLLIGCAEEVRLVDNDEVETYIVATDLPPADVLFVVDDSASMAEEQTRIAADVGAMVAVLADADADVHVGVVTTDAEGPAAGVLIGGVLDRVALAGSLAATLLPGTDGAREERGLAAAELALDGRNPGFRREEATLDIIVLSDEDDQSGGAALDYLYAWQAAAQVGFRLHGVVGDLPAGCFSPEGAADPAERYAAVIEGSGGLQESICAPDYTGILQRLGLDLAGVADTFALRYVPDVATVAVRVEGVEIAADSVNGWTYEPAPNAVLLHGDAVPGPGQRVEIRYTRLAGGSSR